MRLLYKAAAGIAATAGAAEASGFAVEHQNAAAFGTAYAGAAARRADSGYAVYNPAALAGLKRAESSSSAVVLFGPSEFSNAAGTLIGGAPVSGAASGDDVLPPAFVTAGAVAAPVTGRLALGVTLSTPFGLRSKFDPGDAVRYHAQDASLLTLALAPTAAYQLTDDFAIGASVKLQYMDITASTVIDAGGLAFLNGVPGFAPGSSDLYAEFAGGDFDLGWTAGFQWTPNDAVTVGFSYASAIDHDFDGAARFDISGSAAGAALNAATGLFAPTRFRSTLSLPASYALSASAEVSERLTALASVGLTRWSRFDATVINFDNPVQPPDVTTSDWRDTFSASAGVEWTADEATLLRFGFLYDETPVTDAFAGPRIPDTDRRWLTAGLSRDISEKVTLDLAAGFIVAPKDRPVDLDGALPENFLRGSLTAELRTETYAFSARVRYRF